MSDNNHAPAQQAAMPRTTGFVHVRGAREHNFEEY